MNAERERCWLDALKVGMSFDEGKRLALEIDQITGIAASDSLARLRYLLSSWFPLPKPAPRGKRSNKAASHV